MAKEITAGSVGIFWGIPEPDGTWTILVDATSIAEAEPYGDFLTHPRGHYQVWTQWQKTRAAPVANRFITQAIADHEYEFFPRGRIVYNVETGEFILYADRHLQQDATIARIASQFGLAAGTFVVRSDAHYRTLAPPPITTIAIGSRVMPNWTIAAFTHRGRVRSANEDALAVDTHILTGNMDKPLVMSAMNDSCVLMIADGMGGHAQGAMASRAVLDYLVASIDRLSQPATCAEVVGEANQHLYRLMYQQAEALGMGSTIVGAVLKADQLVTFNVGDSRSYLFSTGRLIQLSQDDVSEQENHRPGPRRSHALTQALGGSSLPLQIEPHISIDAPLAPGETLLLCSDGLTDMVDDQTISKVLRSAGTPLQSVRKLAARAFGAGARDNISLVVAWRSDFRP